MKQLRLHQTLRNLTCGDLEIPLVVIGLEVTGLKKTGFMYLLGLFRGRGGRSGGVTSCVCVCVSVCVCVCVCVWSTLG